MGNIAEETGAEGFIENFLDEFHADDDLETSAALRRRLAAMTPDERRQERWKAEAAQGGV